MCGFQLRFSSKKTPRNFIDLVLAILQLFIFSFGKTNGISFFFARFKEKQCLVYFTLGEGFLEINHFKDERNQKENNVKV